MSPNYKNPPIIEAIFDIRIDPVLDVKFLKVIENLHSKISEQYPIKEIFRVMETHFKIEKDKLTESSTVDKGAVGYRFWNQERTQVCLFKLDGFTFSRLRPYHGWENSFSEAMKLWGIYRNECSPNLIKRIAVRNINILEIPFVRFETEDYFNRIPEPPTKSYKAITSFFSRFELFIKGSTRCIITLTTHPQNKPDTTAILFDNDVFEDLAEKPLQSSDDVKIKQLFGILRDTKNNIFEEALKDRMKEFFNV